MWFKNGGYLGELYREYTQSYEECTRWLAGELGLLSHDQLTLTCGATGALDAVLSLFSLRKKIAIMPYEYADVLRISKERGLDIAQMASSEDHNNIEEFILFLQKELPDVCYLSLPNNPLGQDYPDVMIERIFEVMKGRYVIIDQVLVTLSPRTITWFRSYADETKIILVNSFSKSHGLVLERLGYFVLLDTKLERSGYTHAPSRFSLKKVHIFRNRRFLESAIKRISKNSQAIERWAVSFPHYSWQSSQTNFGALHIQSLSSEKCAQYLQGKGIFVKTQQEILCPGNFIRLDLTMPFADTIRLLRYLEDIAESK